MTIDKIVKDIKEQENNRLAQAFTMVIGSLLLSKGIQPMIIKTCVGENTENDDLNKYIFRQEYGVSFDLDTTEHDKEIYNKAIDDMLKQLDTDWKYINKDSVVATHLIIEYREKLKQLKGEKDATN